GDVGRRRYLRLVLPDGASVLGVVYQPEEADSRRRWVAARETLGRRLRGPRLSADDGEGNHSVEDLGRTDVAARRAAQPDDSPRRLAAPVVRRHPPRAPPAPLGFPPRGPPPRPGPFYNLPRPTPLEPPPLAPPDWWPAALSPEAPPPPPALCHRDYHGNNL